MQRYQGQVHWDPNLGSQSSQDDSFYQDVRMDSLSNQHTLENSHLDGRSIQDDSIDIPADARYVNIHIWNQDCQFKG